MLGINEIKKDNLQQYKFLRDRKLFTSNFRIKILRVDDINVQARYLASERVKDPIIGNPSSRKKRWRCNFVSRFLPVHCSYLTFALCLDAREGWNENKQRGRVELFKKKKKKRNGCRRIWVNRSEEGKKIFLFCKIEGAYVLVRVGGIETIFLAILAVRA